MQLGCRLILAAAVALLARPVQAADVSQGYLQGPGGYYKQSDRSGPYSVDSFGNATLLGSGSSAPLPPGTNTIGSTAPLSVTFTTTQVSVPANGTASYPTNGLATPARKTLSYFNESTSTTLRENYGTAPNNSTGYPLPALYGREPPPGTVDQRALYFYNPGSSTVIVDVREGQ